MFRSSYLKWGMFTITLPSPHAKVTHKTFAQAAFLVLEKMGSVTAFSVSNAVKRGFIVSAAAAVMGPPLAHRSVVGAASAVVGTSAYWVGFVLVVVVVGWRMGGW